MNHIDITVLQQLHRWRAQGLHAVLEGIQAPAHAELGTMPSFRYALSDAQIALLLNTMRAQYGLQEWPHLKQTVAKVRAETDPAKARH